MVEAANELGALLETAGHLLAAAGIVEPRREAVRLWSDLSRVTPADTLLAKVASVDAERAAGFLSAVGRRARGEPMAYVTGWTGFRHLTLACDPRALIPRPETEGLVDAALARVRRGTAADIGTGTGAIALALRDEGEFAEVIGTDVAADALALARENGRSTGLEVTWLAGDCLAALAGRRVDLLVSNPPYLTAAEYDNLDASVRDYEPRLALPSGIDGLELTRRLLDAGRAAVNAEGWIALEIDCRRADATAGLAREHGWRDVTVLDDLFGRERYVLARRGTQT